MAEIPTTLTEPARLRAALMERKTLDAAEEEERLKSLTAETREALERLPRIFLELTKAGVLQWKDTPDDKDKQLRFTMAGYHIVYPVKDDYQWLSVGSHKLTGKDVDALGEAIPASQFEKRLKDACTNVVAEFGGYGPTLEEVALRLLEEAKADPHWAPIGQQRIQRVIQQLKRMMAGKD